MRSRVAHVLAGLLISPVCLPAQVTAIRCGTLIGGKSDAPASGKIILIDSHTQSFTRLT